jgi:hypothetical protein
MSWLWIDYVVGYWIVVRPQIAKLPTIFIFDRYADDLAIDLKRFRIGRVKWLASRIPLFVPRPHLIVALHAEPKVIYARKPELPLREIERQVEALRQWSKKLPGAVLIDTSGSIATTRDEVLTAIVKKASERTIG